MLEIFFKKLEGSLGTQGSASHNFNHLGVIKIDKKEISDERIFELAIEAGADECKSTIIIMKFIVLLMKFIMLKKS